MTADIRLSTDLFKNKKIWTLERRLGSKAVFSLIRLWFWTAQCRPDGRLGAAEEDFIAYVAEWKGNGAHFVQALTDLALLDKDEAGIFTVHNWQKRQPYASYLWERSHAPQKPCLSPGPGPAHPICTLQKRILRRAGPMPARLQPTNQPLGDAQTMPTAALHGRIVMPRASADRSLLKRAGASPLPPFPAKTTKRTPQDPRQRTDQPAEDRTLQRRRSRSRI